MFCKKNILSGLVLKREKIVFYLALIIFIQLLIISFPVNVLAQQPEFDLTAQSALLLEAETGEVIFQKEPHQKLPPASMTKIMTMLLVMEELDKGTVGLEDVVVTSDYAARMGGSQIWLEPGEEMTVRDLLKAVAIVSANDASVALAEHLYGTNDAFVRRMNERADQLGMKNTYFYNATGLPTGNEEIQGNFTTAYDMALVARELLKYPKVLEWTSTWIDYLREGNSVLNNTNRLVRHYVGVDGLKTGYTREARYCLTSTAARGDLRFIAVVMGVDNSQVRFNETAELLSYGFNTYTSEIVAEKGEEISKIQILNARQPEVVLVAEEKISLPVKRGEEPEFITEIKIEDRLSAPLEKGSKAGVLQVISDGEIIREVDLVLKENLVKISIRGMMVRLFQQLIVNLISIFS